MYENWIASSPDLREGAGAEHIISIFGLMLPILN